MGLGIFRPSHSKYRVNAPQSCVLHPGADSMSKRLALYAAASPLALSLVGLALPAQAQVDNRYAGVEQVVETYSEPVVQEIGEWESDEAAAGASYTHGDYGYADEAEEDWSDEAAPPMRHMRHHGGYHQGMAPGQPRQLAYSPEQRAEWLSQCRALHASQDEVVYDRRDRDGNEEMIGSVVGAVAGGVIGREVAHRGDRLAGTLIGAGLGGLAGAVVGAVIDGFGDDEDERPLAAAQEPGFDYCEAYLLNYERGYGTPQQMAYAPVMMVPVAQGPTMGMAHHGGARRIIEEEIVVESEEAPRHHTARRVIHRQPQGDKRTPIR